MLTTELAETVDLAQAQAQAQVQAQAGSIRLSHMDTLVQRGGLSRLTRALVECGGKGSTARQILSILHGLLANAPQSQAHRWFWGRGTPSVFGEAATATAAAEPSLKACSALVLVLENGGDLVSLLACCVLLCHIRCIAANE
jgi:hypothetical protein